MSYPSGGKSMTANGMFLSLLSDSFVSQSQMIMKQYSQAVIRHSLGEQTMVVIFTQAMTSLRTATKT